MELPEVTKKLVENSLGSFCEHRVPPHARKQVRLSFGFQDEIVTLFEERVVYNDATRWTKMPIAQFHFNLEDKTWSLFYSDRHEKWHHYDRVKPSRTFNHLLKEVENDPTHIFWG